MYTSFTRNTTSWIVRCAVYKIGAAAPVHVVSRTGCRREPALCASASAVLGLFRLDPLPRALTSFSLSRAPPIARAFSERRSLYDRLAPCIYREPMQPPLDFGEIRRRISSCSLSLSRGDGWSSGIFEIHAAVEERAWVEL